MVNKYGIVLTGFIPQPMIQFCEKRIFVQYCMLLCWRQTKIQY